MLNRVAFEALRRPTAVELMFDRTYGMIGIKPVRPDAHNAFPVRTGPERNLPQDQCRILLPVFRCEGRENRPVPLTGRRSKWRVGTEPGKDYVRNPRLALVDRYACPGGIIFRFSFLFPSFKGMLRFFVADSSFAPKKMPEPLLLARTSDFDRPGLTAPAASIIKGGLRRNVAGFAELLDLDTGS